MVNNGILRNRDLPLKERGLMATLLGLPDQWDFSVNGLAAILPDGRDSIRAGLKRLENMGYLSRYQERKSGGAFGELVVEVHDNPTFSPQTENPFTVNPSTGKPVTEKSTQYNTKEYKTKKYKKQKYLKGDDAYGSERYHGTAVSGTKGQSNWTKEELDLYGF
jgi:hypothetical protein